jgi:hypothetical protein
MATKKSDPRASYIKAGVLLVLLILLYYAAEYLSTKGFPKGFNQLMNAQQQMLAGMQTSRFDSLQQDSIRKVYAGFWTLTPDPTIDTNRCLRWHHVELKQNGIMWEVRRYRFVYPNGDSTAFTDIQQSYVYPWSMRKDPGKPVISQIRVLSHVMIADGDTCYGPTMEMVRSFIPRERKTSSGEKAVMTDTMVEYDQRPVEYVMDHLRKDDTVFLFSKPYVPYTGELAGFFPAGVTRLRDNINLRGCRRALSFQSYALTRATASLAASTVPVRDKQALEGIIRDYYSVILWADIVGKYPTEELLEAPPVDVKIEVKPDGSVAQAKLGKVQLAQTNLQRYILQHVLTWRFPAAKAETRTQTVDYTFRY